jgi:hypothetical protein
MWIRRGDYEKAVSLIEENTALKIKIHELETKPKQWTDADMSTDLIENIARVNRLHFVGSVDNSFFLLQRMEEQKTPGDGVVW